MLIFRHFCRAKTLIYVEVGGIISLLLVISFSKLITLIRINMDSLLDFATGAILALFTYNVCKALSSDDKSKTNKSRA